MCLNESGFIYSGSFGFGLKLVLKLFMSFREKFGCWIALRFGPNFNLILGIGFLSYLNMKKT